MSSKYTTMLFIFEGEKTEQNIISKLQKHFLSTTLPAIKCVFCGNIYQLYKELQADTYIDLVALLKHRHPNNLKLLQGYSTDDFADIYLFFDYDGHAPEANDSQIIEMLNYFNNETEQGKLFISYPMIEAIRHFTDEATFRHLSISLSAGYKKLVEEVRDKTLTQLKITEQWQTLIKAHLCKANELVNDTYTYPSNLVKQDSIFEAQQNKHLHPDPNFRKVSVLSAIPLFLLEYYGVENLEKKL